MKVESVSVFNLIGQEVYQEQVNKNTTQIDLSNYQEGIYFIRMLIDGNLITKKIIIK